MRTADEVLDDELNDNMIKYLDENPIFRAWIVDAMFAYGKEYHESEMLKNHDKKKQI